MAAKVYSQGEQLPPEAELASRFAVNRHTIRRAMADLEQEGLVRIEQGRGTFVQAAAIPYTLGKRTRFSEHLRALGMLGHSAVLQDQQLHSAAIAEHLGLAPSEPLLRVQTLGKADGRVIDLAEHYFSAARFADFAERLRATGSVTQVYAQYGISDYTRKWSMIKATLPSDDIARLLGQAKTRPILKVEALNVDLQGQPLHYSETHFGGDAVQLVVTDQA